MHALEYINPNCQDRSYMDQSIFFLAISSSAYSHPLETHKEHSQLEMEDEEIIFLTLYNRS